MSCSLFGFLIPVLQPRDRFSADAAITRITFEHISVARRGQSTEQPDVTVTLVIVSDFEQVDHFGCPIAPAANERGRHYSSRVRLPFLLSEFLQNRLSALIATHQSHGLMSSVSGWQQFVWMFGSCQKGNSWLLYLWSKQLYRLICSSAKRPDKFGRQISQAQHGHP